MLTATRVDTTGSSLIDYIAGTPDLFHWIDTFEMGNKFPESDHLPIIFSLVAKEGLKVDKKNY